MPLAERADLAARLTLEGNFGREIDAAKRKLGGFQAALSSPRLARAGQQIGTGIQTGAVIAAVGIGLLADQVRRGLDSLARLEVLGAQTNAVIKSTGGVAGITGAEVRRLAEELESLNATIDDKVIQNAENLLLTFTSIRKDAFAPTLKAILDMNAALGGGEEGLQSVTIQVGKALQDPIRGLTALRRVGVNFTKAQEEQIRKLIESNDLYAAQQVILKELNREFGGSFLAQGATTAGKIAKFRDAIEDLQMALANALLPTLGKVADRLSAFLAKPETIRAVEELGQKIAGLFSDKNIATGARIVREAFETIKTALPGLKDAAVITGQILSTAVGLFRSLPPDLQRLAIGALAVNKLTGGLVTNLATGLLNLALGSLRTITAANVTVIGGNIAGGGVGAPVAGKGAGVLQTVKVLGAVTIAGASIGLLADVFNSQREGIKERTGDIGADIQAQIATGVGDLVQSQRALAEGIARLKSIPDFGILTGPAIEDLEAQLRDVNRRLGTIGGDAARNQKSATDRVHDAVERMRGALYSLRIPTPVVNVMTTVSVRAVNNSQTYVRRIGAWNRVISVL